MLPPWHIIDILQPDEQWSLHTNLPSTNALVKRHQVLTRTEDETVHREVVPAATFDRTSLPPVMHEPSAQPRSQLKV